MIIMMTRRRYTWLSPQAARARSCRHRRPPPRALRVSSPWNGRARPLQSKRLLIESRWVSKPLAFAG
jgi:hypothetical protein